MDRFANWLWRRFRRNYIAATAVVLTLFVAGAVAGMAGVTVGIALRVPLKDVLRLSAVNLTGQAVSATCLFLALSGPTARVRRWARGEPEDVTAVWNDTLRYPTKLGQRLALITFPMDHLVIMPIIFGIVGLTRTETIVLHAVTPIMELSAVLVGALGARILATPIARELTPLLPPDAQPAQRELSARRRVAFAVFLAASNAALAAGAVALLVHDNEWRFAWVGLIAILTGSYTSVLVIIGGIRPTIEPLRDFREATERVAAGVYTERMPIGSADEFGDIAIAFNNMQRGLLERASLQAAFGSYVDPALAERVLAQGDATFAGERVDVTVFFADVRGFTTYSALHDAEDAVALLNRFFGLVVPIIRDHGGHANDYSGDSVLAVFGTPQPLDAHADHAVGAAVEMQRAVRQEFGDELRVGIGVNTGKVIAGTIGGGGKLEFTVIGDTVNVASRVEGLTKETGDHILLTQATVDALTDKPGGLCDRGLVDVRGRDEKIHVHGLALS